MMLSYPPVYGIDAYVLLIHQWVATVLPSPKDEETIRKLRTLWGALANALCDFDTKKLAAFTAETAIEDTRDETRGHPPTRAIAERLHAAAQAGIQEGFLAVAMREATEYLIARDLPAALNGWTILADQIVPRQMWFSMRGDQSSPSKVTYSPDM
jgi:hypothetical protein